MNKLILLGLIAFISMNSFAQATLYVDDDFMSNYRNVKINTWGNYPGETISGSPFTTDDFVLGTVIGYKQKYLLKYDAFNDYMLAKRKDDTIMIVNKETITEVTFNDGTKYVVFDYSLDDTMKNGYLEVLLSHSAISLYKKAIVNFSPAVKPASGYDQPKPASFKKGRNRFLVSIDDGQISSFIKKKDFLKLFPDKKTVIEKYVNSNKIKFTKEKDLVDLVNHIISTL
jgi:hypothetical protein